MGHDCAVCKTTAWYVSLPEPRNVLEPQGGGIRVEKPGSQLPIPRTGLGDTDDLPPPLAKGAFSFPQEKIWGGVAFL